ncbi:MAG: 16S rRNA (cytosine(1402)-N(4))-methyltransferase RsmH [Zetaproteobacteria bacterium]|nr:MAG: 16S rRNA (cytosine(1402)-N(4))-methyltransferase RsmH [Zetaproteobacteria bacterium]
MADAGHIPVLAEPFVAALAHRPAGTVVDATFGRGGHSRRLLAALAPAGRLVALDCDPEAVEAGRALQATDPRFCIVHADFADLPQVLDRLGIDRVDGVGFDLGLSSPQLDRPERGFSFERDGPLEMRMNPGEGASLAARLGKVSRHELAGIIRRYGEERYAGRIARRIIEARDAGRLGSTRALAREVVAALPARARHGARRHPATRTFQALRIWVNDEYRRLEQGLEGAIARLAPGGVVAAIAFHSGEDRIVRDRIEAHVHPCICPPQLPRCVCGRQPDMRWRRKKPLRPSAEEVAANPRARSARLRIAVRVDDGA